MNGPDLDYGALLHAAAIVAASRDADPDVRAAANDLLLTEFTAGSSNAGGPQDDPAQTDVEEDEPEFDHGDHPDRSEYIPRAGSDQ